MQAVGLPQQALGIKPDTAEVFIRRVGVNAYPTDENFSNNYIGSILDRGQSALLVGEMAQ